MLRVGLSKKLDPTPNTTFVKFFHINKSLYDIQSHKDLNFNWYFGLKNCEFASMLGTLLT